MKRIFHYRQNGGAFKAEKGFMRTASVNGLPDIVAIKDGIYIGIEVKAPKGKQSESQKAIQAEIEKAGGKYIVARALDDVKVIFEKGKK